MQKFIAFIMFFLFCTNSCADIQTNSQDGYDDYDQVVTNTITKLMRRYKIPGAAVAVVDNDYTYTYVFGVANKTKKEPVTPKTIFEIGSITKLFTALLFITSNNQNQLFDPVTKYWPQLEPNKYLNEITIENLLTHTSGLPFNLSNSLTTTQQAQKYFLRWKPANRIGTRWRYSNVGIGVVGIALENKTGKPLEQLFKEHILNQLNMSSTYIDLNTNSDTQNYIAQGYQARGELALPYTTGIFPAAGDLKSNIQDMSVFLAYAAGSLPVPSDFKQAIQYTQTPKLKIGRAYQGLGWKIHDLNNDTLLHKIIKKIKSKPNSAKWLAHEQQIFDPNKLMDKTGTTTGFKSYIAVIPSKKVGVVVLINKHISSNSAVVNAGRRIILKQPTIVVDDIAIPITHKKTITTKKSRTNKHKKIKAKKITVSKHKFKKPITRLKTNKKLALKKHNS